MTLAQTPFLTGVKSPDSLGDEGKLVEQAKARLQSVFALSEPDSFRWIQRTAMDKVAVSRAVKSLTARKLVQRDTDAADRRRRLLHLTPDRGRPLLENVVPNARRYETRLLEALTPSEFEQLDTLLKPLAEKLTEFRTTVESSHRAETAQHEVLKAKLGEMEKLNERLHEDATSLSRALTSNVKAQGNWGEQQLERLMELAGLIKGEHYYTQYSAIGNHGERLQPDFVLKLPENRSIILDSKVSLTAWTRYQSAEDDAGRQAALAEHVASLKQHVRGLGEKRYAEIPELDSLDFVLMFVPIEAALIAALQADPALSRVSGLAGTEGPDLTRYLLVCAGLSQLALHGVAAPSLPGFHLGIVALPFLGAWLMGLWRPRAARPGS